MNKIKHALSAVSASILASTCYAESKLNLPRGVTPISEDIFSLHMTALIVASLIGLIVFGLIGYCVIFFRQSKHPVPAKFDGNLKIEIIWTIIPFLILIGLAIPATKILSNIHNTSESDITIKVIGHQWKWSYEYLDNDIKFYSYMTTPLDQIEGKVKPSESYLLDVDNDLVVPVNTKIKLLVTSDDVIHSWWVPALGVKQDGIPGFINENWFYAKETGVFRGHCGELCGINHAFMPIVVRVVSKKDYAAWVVNKKRELSRLAAETTKDMSFKDLMRLGKQEYDRNCVMCHRSDGSGIAYTYPALKGSRVVTGTLNEAIIYVLRGVPNAAMQAFGDILDDRQFAAVITYVRNSWGNENIINTENFQLAAKASDVQLMRQRLKGKME